MTANTRDSQRSQVGYGSSYRKAAREETGGAHAIRSVLGGQAWMVKPDQKATTTHPCLWMQAGVVTFKECNNFYDCTSCRYDQGMSIKAARGKQPSWQQLMRRRPDKERTCRHSLTNRIPLRACAYDYQCAKCDFDQYFEDVWTVKSERRPAEIQTVKGFAVPMDFYFHDGHAWATIESGGYLRVGMDDFALKLLGGADAFELPLMGKELDHGKPGWGLRRRDHTADVNSPIDGVIVEVNSNMRQNPRRADQDPYGAGWLFMVRTPDIKKTVKNLMHESGAIDWIGSEVTQLERMVEEVAGPLAADGGVFAQDIYGNLPQLGWDRLTRTFLKT